MALGLLRRSWAASTSFVLLGLLGACTPPERQFAEGGAGGQGGGCPAGFVECDGNPETVCETDTTSSLEHCGTCSNACGALPYANVACIDGACAIESCNEGRLSCDGISDNGCETIPTVTYEHCGACNNSCEASKAITGCVSGVCELAQCVDGFLDCDMQVQTGCEVDPQSTTEHCGACNQPCIPGTNVSTVSCEQGQCKASVCVDGFADCDQNYDNGCETNLLTSAVHCSACGNSCGDGNCSAGQCNVPTLVAKVPFSPGELALFKADLFIGSRATAGEIGTVPITGGNATVIGTGLGQINAIEVSGDGVFTAGTQGAVKMNLDGSGKVTLHSGTTRGIAIGTSNVYMTAALTVRMSPLTGGPSTVFLSTPIATYGLAAANDNIWWSQADGSIYSSPTFMALATQVTVGPATTNNVVVNMAHVYWQSSQGIHSCPLVGGMPTLLAPGGSSVRALAVDDTHVYWTDELAGTVNKVAKDGSAAPMTLATKQMGPWGLVIDNAFVYWSNQGTADIKRIPK